MRARVPVALLALLVVMPSIVLAQRGGGGRPPAPGHTSDDDMGARAGGSPGGAMKLPSASDLEKQSAVHLFLDKKKKLALTDSQVTQLEALAAQLKVQEAPIAQRADSLRKAGAPPSGSFADLSDEERTRLVAWRLVAGDIMDGIRTSERSAAQQALALLTEGQQGKAKELLDQQREEQRRSMRGDGEQNLGKGYSRGGRRP